MRRSPSSYGSSFSFGPGPLSTALKAIIGANVVVFLAQAFVPLDYTLGLVPMLVVRKLWLWQLGTYMFLHGGLSHILFNMLALWMFGMDLERDWGTRRFLKYYFLCGIGAGLCDVLVNAAVGNFNTRTIGSSGGIYGLLLAFGVLYPDRVVLMSFLFPIKAKYFVMIIGAIAFLNSVGSAGSGVSNVAHLGGMLFGYLYLRMGSVGLDAGKLIQRYQEWKLQRAKRKFQVYMRKHGRGPWVN